MATPQELNDFLAASERRAFKHALYQTRDEEVALDIVQDSMMKLVE
ncbi:MAG: polymerase sigma-70 factor, subfamily, partial [Pseudomonadota bacterium]